MPVPQSEPSVPTNSHTIKSILLLDDDIDLADTLKQLLETHNFVVTTVENGVDGVREIMRFDFDLIMCDMMMPKMPGDMFYFAVERTKPHLCPRFVFITGYPDKPEVVNFLSGLKDAVVLHKPVSNDELIRTISFVLKRNGSL
ncbi:MAG TPA: response regulator [Chthoniobacteraceae bacterium]|jgi:DNA-binding response OmpR family regulator|nr:response regulator [Chthoniobacteraceae bacterium]